MMGHKLCFKGEMWLIILKLSLLLLIWNTECPDMQDISFQCLFSHCYKNKNTRKAVDIMSGSALTSASEFEYFAFGVCGKPLKASFAVL